MFDVQHTKFSGRLPVGVGVVEEGGVTKGRGGGGISLGQGSGSMA